jgi:hypothetical protein
MRTAFIEVTQKAGNFNHGKFLVGQFDRDEGGRPSHLPGYEGGRLLGRCGWTPTHFVVMDLQTGEGAIFHRGGNAVADLNKHRVWVCPMFEPFLEWLYAHDWTDVSELPHFVELDTKIAALAGYRREGP